MKRILIPAALAVVAVLTPDGVRAAQSTRGFLYGTVETTGGTSYTGLLRWGKEEAFWGDHFNSAKEDLPHIDRLPKDDRRRRSRIQIFGTDIGYRWSDSYASRQFVARFGDIAEIVPRGGERVDVTMKTGTTYRLKGSSNDVGADVTIQDAAIGAVTIPWRKIERVRFQSTPGNLEPEGFRIYGLLKSDDFTFEGFVQWDSEECLSIDVLNGSTDDGKLAIEMGRIASIARDGRNRSEVVLRDGRSFTMSGTNDVDHSIRGIFVEDRRLGRVKVNWDSFDRLDFREVSDSGPAYDDFKPRRHIAGRVTDVDGKTLSGRIVFDLDEAETWELLNGNRYDVEYNIPFDQIRSIEPRNRSSSLVTLRNGADVVLEDTQDVSDRNDGVVVLDDRGDDGTYIPWDEIRRIELD